jgi:predicted nucleic acid-binding protein
LTQAAYPLDLEASAALQAGAVYWGWRAKGQLLETAELLIAGCYLAAGWPLLTRNTEHFSRVRGLKLVEDERLLETGE